MEGLSKNYGVDSVKYNRNTVAQMAVRSTSADISIQIENDNLSTKNR